MVVEHVMTRNPVVVEWSESLQRVQELLYTLDTRHLPVTKAGSLCGIISEADLAGPQAAGEAPRRLSAEDIMSKKLVTVTPKSELSHAIDLMLERRIRALPVVDSGSLRLVGIVSYVDILRAARPLV